MTPPQPRSGPIATALPRSGPGDGLPEDDPEELVVVHDRPSGLRAAVSIHSTVLGPALGGCRFHPYPTIAAGVTDAVRLGAAMTAKAAVAGLDLGGGKAVVIGSPGQPHARQVVLAFARVVDRLGGRYITAEDVGTTMADMDLIGTVTPHVVGRSPDRGGGGDPSGSTALGVLAAMEATVRHVTGAADLVGCRVVVLGVGKVGGELVGLLVAAGAQVTVADVDRAAVGALQDRFGVAAVAPDVAHRAPGDVFAPCAMGGVLGGGRIAELGCPVVVGSANNQLLEPADADRLADAGVVYAPDYVVNAGGLIHVADERHGFDADRVRARVLGIGATLTGLMAEADRDGITPSEAADRVARRRIAARVAELTAGPAGDQPTSPRSGGRAA